MIIPKLYNNPQDLVLRNPAGHTITRFLSVLLLASLALTAILASPAQAGNDYTTSGPQLSVSLSGGNEFSPGQEVRLPVIAKNTGLASLKVTKTSIVDRDDLLNTAKFLTMTLGSGDSPVIIKSDPQVLGDLKASSSVTGTFTVRIPADTPAGTYTLPVVLNYTYLYNADQSGVDTIAYTYKSKEEHYSIPIHIRPDVRTQVVSTEVSNLNAGMEGYIGLSVMNVGNESAKKAIIMISRNGQSPIVPTEGRMYVGDFPPGAIVNCTFKAMVNKGAEAQTYPLDLIVRYEDHNGDTLTSSTETIGIPVGRKVTFSVVPDTTPISPGEKKVISIKYTNTGSATAYDAQARISMVDPFSSNDDSAYLGDMAPGESKTASFLVTADKAAALKEYGVDSEVRYQDVLDNTAISDPIKISLTVSKGKDSVSAILGNPLFLAFVVVIIAVLAYVVYRKKKLLH